MAIDASEMNDLLYGQAQNDSLTLPSGKVALVAEMTGAEQRNFMNRAKLSNGTAVQELLAKCLVAIDGEELPLDPKERVEFVTSLLSADRRALMFGIRVHSLGNEFRFTMQCPACKAKETWEVDLTDKTAFPVTPCPAGDLREFEYDSTLRPGLRIKIKMLDGRAEMAIIRRRDTLDSLTDLELRQPRAHTVSGGVASWVPIQLNKVPDKLIAEMRTRIKSQEGDIRTTVKVVCNSCSGEVEFDLLQIPDFLTPSGNS